MQQELTDLQPQLIKTSAETERLMKKIEVDTVEVEAKKEVRTGRQCWHSTLRLQLRFSGIIMFTFFPQLLQYLVVFHRVILHIDLCHVKFEQQTLMAGCYVRYSRP